MSAPQDIWQVQIGAEIYQADYTEFTQWITEGQVLPTDKVRKENMRWIDAGRVPSLRQFFTQTTIAAPSMSATTHAPTSFDSTSHHAPHHSAPHVEESTFHEPHAPEDSLHQNSFDNFNTAHQTHSHFSHALPHADTNCHFHADVKAKYVCRACAATFCAECPKFVSTSKIALCPLCGELCKLCVEVKAKAQQAQFQGGGFGMEDFMRAWRYPFTHIGSLLGGAVLYALLLFAGGRGRLIAWAIIFGCISLVIRQVSWGKLERSFMPDFSEFSIWDDAVRPLFLSFGIGLVTLTPLIVLFAALLYGGLNGASSASSKELLGLPSAQPTPAFNAKEFQDLMKSDDPNKAEELQRKLKGLQMSSATGMTPDQLKPKGANGMDATTMLGLTGFSPRALGWWLVAFVVAILWAAFYYPMALTIAGYTQEFKAVVNPLVGLDTMRRMGGTYVKAFIMYLCIQVVSFIVGLIVALVTASFDMPMVGNLPSTFIMGVLTFYFSLVLACTLGLALYKSADELGIPVD
ncbi:MAG: hypothetical protein NVSMB56_05340 [Pyrinomonadaceae bacterium]